MNVSLTGSYAVNRGRPEVRVAFTDTGVDQTHPDIQANLDAADSTSFVTDAVVFDGNGNPVPIVAEPDIQDYNGHGTWTASAVGAPINGVGISGVAPNVSIVELKTQDMNGNGLLLWFDQAMVYAGKKHFDIVSSSITSYVQKCRGGDDDTKQNCDDADYMLARRAVKYARDNGVLTVAAMGNDNLDLADGEGARQRPGLRRSRRRRGSPAAFPVWLASPRPVMRTRRRTTRTTARASSTSRLPVGIRASSSRRPISTARAASSSARGRAPRRAVRRSRSTTAAPADASTRACTGRRCRRRTRQASRR